jgi:hypothetical protein
VLKLAVAASTASPVVNPAFVIRGFIEAQKEQPLEMLLEPLP